MSINVTSTVRLPFGGSQRPSAEEIYTEAELCQRLQTDIADIGEIGPMLRILLRRVERLETENSILWRILCPTTARDTSRPDPVFDGD